jgi:hypothetical protein
MAVKGEQWAPWSSSDWYKILTFEDERCIGSDEDSGTTFGVTQVDQGMSAIPSTALDPASGVQEGADGAVLGVGSNVALDIKVAVPAEGVDDPVGDALGGASGCLECDIDATDFVVRDVVPLEEGAYGYYIRD